MTTAQQNLLTKIITETADGSDFLAVSKQFHPIYRLLRANRALFESFGILYSIGNNQGNTVIRLDDGSEEDYRYILIGTKSSPILEIRHRSLTIWGADPANTHIPKQ